MASAAPEAENVAPAVEAGVSGLRTPFALIEGQRLRANIAEMQGAVEGLGAALRPHFKTHRTVAIARWQRDAGASGVTVATVRQLVTARRELSCPVLVSGILQADSAAASVLRDACSGNETLFAIESPQSVEQLRAALGPDVPAEVMIEVEAGCLRSGVAPTECGELAQLAARQGFGIAGVFSYPGHSYRPGVSREASDQERAALDEAAAELVRAGFDPRLVSAGSTPTMPHARPGVANEYRPGTYVFGDRQQLTLGAVRREQLSLTVVASVVALHGNRLVLDAGGKALGRDAPRWLDGFGQLADASEAVVDRLYDHHAVIEAYRGPSRAVGDRVAIIPNNANSAMVLARSVWITDDGETAAELRPQPDA